MSTPRMRAKFLITKVSEWEGGAGETIIAEAVGASDAGYGPNGENEDNDFARYTPMGQLTMSVTNPELIGKIKAGDQFYIDLMPVFGTSPEPVAQA